jgi:hypothetical protein
MERTASFILRHIGRTGNVGGPFIAVLNAWKFSLHSAQAEFLLQRERMMLKHCLTHGGNIRASKTAENDLSIHCFSACDR